MLKSLNIWFKYKKKNIIESSVKLYEERVSQCKFGITPTDYMSNSMDSNWVLNKFLNSWDNTILCIIFLIFLAER